MSNRAHVERLKPYLGLDKRIILPEPDEFSSEKPSPLENIRSPESTISSEKPSLIENINSPENTVLPEKPSTLEKKKSAENIVPLEQSVDTENVKVGDSNCDANVEKIRWFNDFFILKHRFRHQCIEYLVKQRNDLDF